MSDINLELPDYGYAFLEPRCLFDSAISSLESNAESNKIYYNLSKVQDICLTHYNESTWQRLLKKVNNIKEVIELI